MCAALAAGNSVAAMSEQDGMPDVQTVFLWMAGMYGAPPSWTESYVRATSNRGHARFESMDVIIQELRDKKLDPNSARVILDTWKWMAAREAPKRYGEKLELSGDANNPLVISVRRESSDQPKTIDVTPSK